MTLDVREEAALEVAPGSVVRAAMRSGSSRASRPHRMDELLTVPGFSELVRDTTAPC